jgi:hypothetical protein
VRFLLVFTSFRIRIQFNFSIFVSLALKIHNCTDLKFVREQHWNFNELTLFTDTVGPDEINCALGLENVPRPSGSGRFQDLGISFSHPDLATGK